MANNQDQAQQDAQRRANQAQQGQTLEQQRAQADQQGGRLNADQQAAQQRSGGQQQGGQQGGQQRAGQQPGGQQQGGQQPTGQSQVDQAQQQAQQARRAQFDEQKRAVAERPQQVGDEGQQPTPTQQENDEIRAGLRHIDDKEDDRSGPDFVHNRVVRRVDAADQQKGKYETR